MTGIEEFFAYIEKLIGERYAAHPQIGVMKIFLD